MNELTKIHKSMRYAYDLGQGLEDYKFHIAEQLHLSFDP